MLNLKAKMRINLSVKDYIQMFPEEYQNFLIVIQQQRDQLENEMAELRETHAIKRGLATLPAKLFEMVQKKLDKHEFAEFKQTENQYWFLREWPQFRLTRNI